MGTRDLTASFGFVRSRGRRGPAGRGAARAPVDLELLLSRYRAPASTTSAGTTSRRKASPSHSRQSRPSSIANAGLQKTTSPDGPSKTERWVACGWPGASRDALGSPNRAIPVRSRETPGSIAFHKICITA